MPRERCRKLVDDLDGDPALRGTDATSTEPQWNPEIFADVRATLVSPTETLTEQQQASLEALADRLRAIRHPEPNGETEGQLSDEDLRRATARESAASTLVELARIERLPRPVLQVINALSARAPEIAFFVEADRELRSTYNLNEVASDTPPALRNLCALADLDLAAVQSDVTAGQVPHIEAVFEAANARLKERFHDTWRQSDVYPRLTPPLDGGAMRILMGVEGGADYSYPEEHSDGILWFMALHAFLVARGGRQPVLLVDEAETHLHYDAQADLIDALMNQRIARQIIYTTHSVGCLPPDLGCGIRVVLAARSTERSQIVNSYWSVDPGADQKLGYTPLLFGMGARLLSLTIPRYGVIVEGPSDAILLPSLLREAAGIGSLPYRIVPGLSDIAGAEVSSLPHHAGKVVSLTDGDDGGLEICAKLRAGGIAADDIFNLGQVRDGCSLEDIVDAEVFADAINRELTTWNIGPFRASASDLPASGRWTWLVETGVRTGTPIERLSKPRIAQRVVDIGREMTAQQSHRRLVDSADSDGVRLLHETISAALGLTDQTA